MEYIIIFYQQKKIIKKLIILLKIRKQTLSNEFFTNENGNPNNIPFKGNYILLEEKKDLELEDIPEYLNIILMGDAVRNTYLDSHRTYTCSHCSEHRGLTPKNPRSYLELTEIISSYPFYILNGYMFLLGKMMIDAIKILREIEIDESDWERLKELLSAVS